MSSAPVSYTHLIESYSPPLDGERYLTDKELSEHLKLSRRTLQEYRKQGILPYIILCGKTLYPESEIQALLTGNYLSLIHIWFSSL